MILIFRITKEEGKIYYLNEIVLKYYVRGTYLGLWRQFFQYGYWKVYVNKKQGTITTLRQVVPPLFVLYLFLLPFTLLINTNLFYISSIGLLLYLSLLVYSAIKMSSSEKGVSVFNLAKTYIILHISYGLGYLRGIIDFLLFKKTPSAKQKRLSR